MLYSDLTLYHETTTRSVLESLAHHADSIYIKGNVPAFNPEANNLNNESEQPSLADEAQIPQTPTSSEIESLAHHADSIYIKANVPAFYQAQLDGMDSSSYWLSEEEIEDLVKRLTNSFISDSELRLILARAPFPSLNAILSRIYDQFDFIVFEKSKQRLEGIVEGYRYRGEMSEENLENVVELLRAWPEVPEVLDTLKSVSSNAILAAWELLRRTEGAQELQALARLLSYSQLGLANKMCKVVESWAQQSPAPSISQLQSELLACATSAELKAFAKKYSQYRAALIQAYRGLLTSEQLQIDSLKASSVSQEVFKYTGETVNESGQTLRDGALVYIDPDSTQGPRSSYVKVWVLNGLSRGCQKAVSVSRDFLTLIDKAINPTASKIEGEQGELFGSS